MILITGGVLRDLLRMIKDAAELAIEKEEETLNETHYTYAYRNLLKAYRNTIAEYYDSSRNITISPEEFYKELSELANDKLKQPNNSEKMLLLRYNLCVLSYNEENWSDVHPIVKDLLKEKGLLAD